MAAASRPGSAAAFPSAFAGVLVLRLDALAALGQHMSL